MIGSHKSLFTVNREKLKEHRLSDQFDGQQITCRRRRVRHHLPASPSLCSGRRPWCRMSCSADSFVRWSGVDCLRRIQAEHTHRRRPGRSAAPARRTWRGCARREPCRRVASGVAAGHARGWCHLVPARRAGRMWSDQERRTNSSKMTWKVAALLVLW